VNHRTRSADIEALAEAVLACGQALETDTLDAAS
jgi:hypothetical protein